MLSMILSNAAAMALPESDSRFLRTYMPRGDQVVMELFLAPDGKVLECDLLLPKRDTAEAAKLCAKTFGKRAAKTPPLGPQGNPVHGVITAGIFRVQSGFRPEVPPPPQATLAVEVTVNKLPGNAKEITHTVLAFIDESGVLAHCERVGVERSTGEGLACQIAARKKFPVRRGQDGMPVGYLTYLPVIFAAK